MFFLSFAMIFEVLVLAFGLLVELDILDVYFYRQLLQAFIILLFGQIRTVADKINLYSTCSITFRLDEDGS